MRRLKLLVLFCILSVAAYSQTLQPSSLPTTNAPSSWYNLRAVKDSFLMFVARDTFPAKYPSLLYHTNGNFYYSDGNGSRWKNIASSAYVETDPIFLAHVSSSITSTNVSNWNTAYGWGNHAGLYPLTQRFLDSIVTLRTYISDVETAYINADGDLQDDIEAETTYRENADVVINDSLAAHNSRILANLNNINANTASILTKADTSLVKINPTDGYSVLPLHYGLLRGRGGLIGESYSTQIYTVASSASAGATTITLTANSSNNSQALIVGQLIVYLGTDGEYYTASIRSIAGAVITLNSALEVGVGTGQNVFNAYVNNYHLTTYGFYAYADYLIRKNKTRFNVETRTAFNAIYNGGTAVLDTINSFDNPGSKGVTSWVVTSPTTNDGIKATFTVYKTGAYKIPIAINTYGNNVTITAVAGGYSNSITVNSNDVTIADIPFWIYSSNSTVTILVHAATGGQSFEIKQNALVLKEDGLAPKLNSHVKIVLMGDSWFAFAGVAERLQARLPNAEIINLGVGGRTASNLADAFDTEVAPLKPDIIICNTSTNDYANLNYSVNLFGFFINRLKTQSSLSGSHLIIATPTVAPENAVAGAFNLSRSYADSVTYFNEILPVPVVTPTLAQVTASGNTTTLGATFGSTGTSNTGSFFGTDGTAGVPAVTAFKNITTTSTEPVIKSGAFHSGVGIEYNAYIRANGIVEGTGFTKTGGTGTKILMDNGTTKDSSTLLHSSDVIPNNGTTTADNRSFNISGSATFSLSGSAKVAIGVTQAQAQTKLHVADVANSHSFFATGGAAGNGVALGAFGNVPDIQAFTAAGAVRNLLIQPSGKRVSFGGGEPDTSALIDMKGVTAGLLIPRVSTTQRDAISSPATGLQVYNTTTNRINWYNGSSWSAVPDSTVASAIYLAKSDSTLYSTKANSTKQRDSVVALIPTNNNQLSNGAGYLTSINLYLGNTIRGNNTTISPLEVNQSGLTTDSIPQGSTNKYFSNSLVDTRISAYTGDVTFSSGVSTIGAAKVTNSMLAGSIDLTSKVTGALPVTNGGNGLATATLGDLRYGSGTNTLAALAGNTTSTKKFLSQTGTGSVSAAPSWSTLSSSDMPSGYGAKIAATTTALSSVTGTTAETTLYTATISASSVGIGGSLDISYVYNHTNSAGTKRYQVKLNGTTVSDFTATTSATAGKFITTVTNTDNSNALLDIGATGQGAIGFNATSGGASSTFALDWTSNITLTVTCTLSATSDTGSLRRLRAVAVN